jgi:hypothetical protein
MFERQLLSVVPWSLLALPVNPFRISSLSTMPRKRTYRKVKNKIFALVLFNASNKSLNACNHRGYQSSCPFRLSVIWKMLLHVFLNKRCKKRKILSCCAKSPVLLSANIPQCLHLHETFMDVQTFRSHPVLQQR